MRWPGVALVILGAIGCTLGSPQSDAQPRAPEVVSESARPPQDRPPKRRFSITDSINEFAIDLSVNRLAGGNLVFSPFSIVSVMNMLLLGTSDNTYEQLRTALKYPFEMKDLLIHQQSGVQLRSLHRASQGIDVQIANRIFTDSRFRIKESFMRNARDFYQAGVEQLEFGKKPVVAARRINEWVRDHTNGKIETLLENPPPRNTRMIATNVVYFNSTWQTPFDPKDTKKLTFHLGDRQTIKVNMMYKDMEAPFASFASDGFRALALPYQGGQYAMYILLPDEAGEAPLAALESKLTNDNLRQIFSSLRPTNISVWLPRFQLEHSLALRDVLQAMGAVDLFQESRALFDRLSPDRQLFLSEVIHQAVIDVHEAGTEAAAVTVTLVNRDRLAKEFRVNRPFVFVIRDNRTGVPLFWGRIVRPE